MAQARGAGSGGNKFSGASLWLRHGKHVKRANDDLHLGIGKESVFAAMHWGRRKMMIYANTLTHLERRMKVLP